VFYEYRFVSPPQPVTMRHVADAAGVSVSTVSKALRNDPSIPLKRCQAIQESARKLGYRPHPMISALMAQMHHHRRRSDPPNVAWIDLWPARENCAAVMDSAPLLSGARARAQELGYGLEVYPVGTERMSPERLRLTLAARGQWGLIIPPVPESAIKFPLDLNGLTGVTIGTSLHEPVLHRVSPNHYQGCILAWTQLRAMGFHRIGLVLSPEMNLRVESKWLGAFLACQQQLPKRERVAPLLAAPGNHAAVARWLRRETPEAILVAEQFPWQQANVLNRRPFDQAHVAWLMRQRGLRGLGGLDHQPEQLGRAAVDMVVAQIHRNERGSPAIPHTVLIDAAWTTPRV